MSVVGKFNNRIIRLSNELVELNRSVISFDCFRHGSHKFPGSDFTVLKKIGIRLKKKFENIYFNVLLKTQIK